MHVSDIKVAYSAPDHLSDIVAFLIDCRIGAEESWSAEVVLQASLNERFAGCCAIDFVEDVAILHGLAVKKELRRNGIGKKLVSFAVDVAEGRQVRYMVALTMFWNVNFFRKCGFATCSRRAVPGRLDGNPLIYDPALSRTTPMIRRIRFDEEA